MNIFTSNRAERAEHSEQEQLASLIPEDKEILNPGEMMWANLKNTLQGTNLEQSNKIPEELHNLVITNPKQSKQASTQSDIVASPINNNNRNISSEKILKFLFAHYDDLVDVFAKSGIDSNISNDLIEIIHGLETCIKYMGGEINTFEPFNHISGLDVPDFYKNANRVIETTKQCYKMGSILDTSVEDDGRKINIVFAGKYKSVVDYVVYGSISTPLWNGNEAIDYIYSADGGKMSVKVFEEGKWIDKSLTGKYSINWDVEQKDLEKDLENIKDEKEVDTPIQNNTEENKENLENKENNIKISENINPVKEDIKQEENNKDKLKENLEDEEADLSDFPIIDRQT